jgi:DNA-binding CsgD family transcriptional regulator
VRDPAAQRTFQRWVDLVGDLLLRPHPAMPIEQLLGELYLTFDTEVSWAWRDADETFGFLMYHPIPGWPADGQLELWAEEALSLHPLINWFRATGDLTAMTLARVPARAADPRGLQILRHHLLPVGLEQQLSIPYRQTATGTYRAFVLAKGGTDFSDADVTVARRIQPLLVLLARQCRVLVGYAACGPVGETGEGAAPAAAPWDRPANAGRDRQASAVEETSLILGLTGRELAVLRLLADGKTAAAIGRTLGISPRTVHVHLTHVYGKLGVHDRLMAVSVARQVGLLSFAPTAWTTVVPRPRHPEQVPTTVADVRGQRAVAWRPGLGAILFDPAP